MRNFPGSTGYHGGDYKYLLSSSTAKFVAPRAFADPDIAARKLVEIGE
jgi:hypothetical protein